MNLKVKDVIGSPYESTVKNFISFLNLCPLLKRSCLTIKHSFKLVPTEFDKLMLVTDVDDKK